MPSALINFQTSYKMTSQPTVVAWKKEKKNSTTLNFFRLQESSEGVPFRCVDEINQGMDGSNELAIWNILFESAQQESSQV